MISRNSIISCVPADDSATRIRVTVLATAVMLLHIGVVQGQNTGGRARHEMAVRVTTVAGEPIIGAEVFVVDSESASVSKVWTPVVNGQVLVSSEDCVGVYTNAEFPPSVHVVARAPGYAWTMEEVLVGKQTPHEMTLAKGHPVEIVLDVPVGRSVPEDLVPQVFVEGQSVAAWLTGVQYRAKDTAQSAVFSSGVMERLRSGHFKFQVPETCDELFVIVNHEGFLRGFQAGPIKREQFLSGKVEIALPLPGSVHATVKPKPKSRHDYESCGVLVRAAPKIPDGNWSFTLPPQFQAGQSCEIVYADLAPRRWNVEAVTGEPGPLRFGDQFPALAILSPISFQADSCRRSHQA